MSTVDPEFDEIYEKPLIPEDFGGPPEDVVYDESGMLELAAIRAASPNSIPEPHHLQWKRPCGLGALDGSWNIVIRPRFQLLLGAVRGPMRIEATADVLRVSGDVYYKKQLINLERAEETDPVASAGFVRHWKWNWYPHYPFKQYVWYFRSTGASYTNGELFFPLTRHLWDKATEEFVSTDQGWMRFPCSTSVLTHRWWPQPTLRMEGTAMIGGKLHSVTATKTSPYYRGCVVEVDVMTNRSWPGNPNGQSFTGTFRGDGLDVRAYVSQTNIPEDSALTDAECHSLMASNRAISNIGHTWRVWTLVGSQRSGAIQPLGLMFDSTAPHREGCVSYADERFGNGLDLDPSARGQALGNIPLAHLRTLIHEVGHCFNLFHPKADDHNPPIGETIMNQTSDVRGFATPGNLYPNNAEFAFSDHNRSSLIHSPDPQVAPGWKEFGWGHSSPDLGVPEPTDLVGLRDASPPEADLVLSLDVPEVATIGEFVLAEVKVTNNGSEARHVYNTLNLAEGNLDIVVRGPAGKSVAVRDVVQLCGTNRVVDLPAGESISAAVQLFYTNCGHTFATPGTYELTATYSSAPGSTERLLSVSHAIQVVAPSSAAERTMAELSMNDDVGLSIAFGEFGADNEAAEKLKTLSRDFTRTDTGTAAALVLANSYGRSFRDLRDGSVSRRSSSREVSMAMGRAMRDTRADRVAAISTTVVSALDTDAPALKEIREHIEANKKTTGGKTASTRALQILADYAS